MAGHGKGAADIWRNGQIPVVYRPPGRSPLLVRLPFSQENRSWLQNGGRTRPKWLPQYKCWALPRSWFADLVEDLLNKYKLTYIIQEVREKEICAPACWKAKGLECTCSCLGKHHGEQNPEGRWYEITEALAVRWKNHSLRWSLLRLKES